MGTKLDNPPGQPARRQESGLVPYRMNQNNVSSLPLTPSPSVSPRTEPTSVNVGDSYLIAITPFPLYIPREGAASISSSGILDDNTQTGQNNPSCTLHRRAVRGRTRHRLQTHAQPSVQAWSRVVPWGRVKLSDIRHGWSGIHQALFGKGLHKGAHICLSEFAGDAETVDERGHQLLGFPVLDQQAQQHGSGSVRGEVGEIGRASCRDRGTRCACTESAE